MCVFDVSHDKRSASLCVGTRTPHAPDLDAWTDAGDVSVALFTLSLGTRALTKALQNSADDLTATATLHVALVAEVLHIDQPNQPIYVTAHPALPVSFKLPSSV
jgi:hypothetical protein